MRLKVSFLERDFFAESRDGKSIKGHEPAIIETEEGVRIGRVVRTERLSQAQFVDTLLFQTFLPLANASYGLADLVGNNVSGQKRINQFRNHFLRYHGERIPEIIEIRPLEMPPLKYKWVSEDYMTTKKAGDGLIDLLPEQMVYVKIIPPVKYADGKWVQRINYMRKVVFSDG